MKTLVCTISFFLFLILNCSVQGQDKQLSELLSKEVQDTSKVNLLIRIAREQCANKPDSSLVLGKKALELSRKAGWQMGEGMSLHQIAVAYYYKGEYSPAMDYYSNALASWNKLLQTDPKNTRVRMKRSGTLGNIGAIYYSQGDYPHAIQNYLMILKTDEQLKDSKSIAEDYCCLGVVYNDLKEYSKSLDYYFKALRIDKELGNKEGMSAEMGNMGSVYHEQGETFLKDGDTASANQYFLKALDYEFKSLYLRESVGNKFNQAIQLGNIGNLYHSMNNLPLALQYMLRSLELHKELGNKRGIVLQTANIGALYTKTKQFSKAESFLLRALALSDSIGALNEQMNTENYISNLYAEMGNDKKALEYYKKSIVLKETLFNQEKDKEITRKAMTYEFEKKEEIAKAEQEKKDAVAALEKNRQRIFLGFLLVLIIAVAVIAVMIFRSLQQSRRARKMIEAQRDEISRQKEEVELQKLLVEAHQKEIIDSIHYAKRIQQALLPRENYIGKNLKRLQR
jgi:tetratricopeptide (TPR) repeat protein